MSQGTIKHNKEVYYVCGIFLIVCLGLFIISQNIGSGQNDRQIQTLYQTLGDEREKNALLEGQIMQYEEELTRYREDVKTTGAYTSILLKELSEAKILAGLTAIEGPGVIVTLRDGADNVIHDSNLLIVLNELKDAGAEALSLNQQRIVATSEVRCAGAIVSVNNVRCGAPFIIQAIGDPQVLFSALFLNGGVVDSLEAWDIHVTVEMSDSLRIAAYGGDRRFQFASSVDEQTK